MNTYKKPLSPWTFLIVGILVMGFSFWINGFSLSGKFTVFLVAGFLFVLFGFIKIPFHRKRSDKRLACPDCGSTVKEGDVYCPSCGRQLKPLPKS